MIEFKENLRVLLLSVLFVLLAARLDLAMLQDLGWGGLVFVLALVFIARPLSIYFCTIGTTLTRAERIFLCWMAPRGIVAAAVTAVFALSLAERGYEGAERMVPATFLVIGITVLIYGLTAGPLAKYLKLAISNPQGSVIIGAHEPARQLAKALKNEGFEVLLVDSNWRNVTIARQADIPAHFGDALSERLLDELQLDKMGRVLALTGNYTVNALATLHFSEVFGRSQTYQLATEGASAKKHDDTDLPKHLRGRILFGDEVPFRLLSERIWSGAKIKITPLTETFTFKKYQAQNPDAIPLFAITEDKRLIVFTAEEAPSAQPGQKLVCLATDND